MYEKFSYSCEFWRYWDMKNIILKISQNTILDYNTIIIIVKNRSETILNI